MNILRTTRYYVLRFSGERAARYLAHTSRGNIGWHAVVEEGEANKFTTEEGIVTAMADIRAHHPEWMHAIVVCLITHEERAMKPEEVKSLT